MQHPISRVLPLVLACALPMGQSLAAQQQTVSSSEASTTAAAAAENNQIEQIVVTGRASGLSGLKVNSAYAITSVSEATIEKINPKSTAELFSLVPGVWAESSGGVAGANVFVRGFPSGGDAPFLTVQLQGAPIFPAPTLSFLENSSMFRVDETIDFMEALRGGSTPVISNGQPGLTTNFRLKEGTETTEGLLKYSTADYGLQRMDGVVSGELADKLYFMIGGYVASSTGVRDAGFNSEQGKQFTLNLTKDLDNGRISLFHRDTDDHGVWYLPAPLNVEGVDNQYTQIGPLNRQASIQFGPDGERRQDDYGDGRSWDGRITGLNADLDLTDSWALVYRMNLTDGAANTLGMVPDGGAVKLATVADNGSSATGAATGELYDRNTDVQKIGRWVVLKDIHALTHDVALTHSGDVGRYTFGMYSSQYDVKDWWSIGNQAWYAVRSGGELLTGIACNDSIDSCGWNYDIDASGDGTTRAIYGAGEWQLTDQWTLDAGLRSENHQVGYSVDEGLVGKPSKAVSYDESEIAWTAGANWMWQRSMGVFARINRGNKMPYFDDFRDNYAAYQAGDKLIKEVTQYELGYKWAEQNFSLYATGFINEVKGDTFVRVPGAPAQVLTNEAQGLELDANYFSKTGFTLNLNATVQHTEITESPTNLGNQAQRQPKWQLRLSPAYELELAGTAATLYGTLAAVSDRYANNENTVVLPSYTKIDAGVQLQLTQQLKAQLSVDNLTDKAGLTEGDPRDPASPNGRYILPRSISLSVTYHF